MGVGASPGELELKVLLYYMWYPTSREYFQSRISPRFCFKIPHPEKLIGTLLVSIRISVIYGTTLL